MLCDVLVLVVYGLLFVVVDDSEENVCCCNNIVVLFVFEEWVFVLMLVFLEGKVCFVVVVGDMDEVEDNMEQVFVVVEELEQKFFYFDDFFFECEKFVLVVVLKFFLGQCVQVFEGVELRSIYV